MRSAARLLLAGTALAGSFTMSAPAQAQPCLPDLGVVWFCALTESWYRGASGGVRPGSAFVVGGSCYYPGGRPHYFVHAYTTATGTIVEYTIPVSAPCV